MATTKRGGKAAKPARSKAGVRAAVAETDGRTSADVLAELSVEELQMYGELSEAMRGFEVVAFHHFMKADGPIERTAVVAGALRHIENYYREEIGLNASFGVSNCGPFCRCGSRCCMCA